MAYINLTFPLLIQPGNTGKNKYTMIRPLFLDEPCVKDRRYNIALMKFKQAVHNFFRDKNFSRNNLNTYLWYVFNPEIRYEKIEICLESGHEVVQGEFSYVYFSLKEQMFISLPGFSNHMFIAKRNEKGEFDIRTQVDNTIRNLIRREQKLKAGSYALKERISQKGEFVSFFKTEIFTPDNEFESLFEEQDFFGVNYGHETLFHGNIEIYKVGYDMNQLYPDKLQRAEGRKGILGQLEASFFGQKPVAIVLIGPKGCGKTTTLHETLYQYILKNDKKKFHTLIKIWHLDPMRIISGMNVIGMWQNRVEAILEYIIERKNITGGSPDILFVDNMVALLSIGKSSQNEMALSNLLKTYLEKREFSMIGEATNEEWRIIQESDRKFADLFQVIRLEEINLETTMKIFLHEKARLELEHGCYFDPDAVKEIFDLRGRFMQHHSMPGSVISILKNTAGKFSPGRICACDVRETFEDTGKMSYRIGMRSQRISDQDISDFFKSFLIGQDHVVSHLSDMIHLIKAGLNDPQKPYATLLFIGPTGVGKTQAAKILCRYLFASEENLVRFDMNEFIDSSATRRLIGDFFHSQGQLTNKVRFQPFCILLLDEIEKAHSSVHDLLLQVLSEGRLTDAMGRTVDFSHTIVVMTSNLGAREAVRRPGFQETYENQDPVYLKAVKDFFSPEFLNRIDQILIFRQLELKDIKKIARLQIQELLGRYGFNNRKVFVSISDKVIEHIAEKGFEPEMGARALKRSIENDLIVLTADCLVDVHIRDPVLLEIFLCLGKFCPEITVLKETPQIKKSIIQSIPDIPDLKTRLKILRQLLEFLENLQEKISHGKSREGDKHNWMQYYMKDFAYDTRNQLVNEIFELEEAQENVKFNSPSSNIIKKSVPRVFNYKNIMEVFTQIEIHEYLYQLFTASNNLYKDDLDGILRYLLEIAYIHFFHEALVKNRVQKVCIQIQTLNENTGIDERNYLYKLYNEMLEKMKLPRDAFLKENELQSNDYLFSEGPGLYDLFKGEQGAHIFFNPLKNTQLILVFIHNVPESLTCSDFIKNLIKQRDLMYGKLNKGEISSKELMRNFVKIIRLYSIQPDLKIRKNTVTDIRTGTVYREEMLRESFKLLLYEGLDDKYKASLGE